MRYAGVWTAGMALVAAVALSMAGCAKTGAPGETQVPTGETTVTAFVPDAPREVAPRHTIARAPRAVTVDGDLSEWAGVPAVVLDKQEQVYERSGKWDGPADCSGSARFCYDSGFLYLAFDVTDDVFCQNRVGWATYVEDCVRFSIDPFEDRAERSLGKRGVKLTVALTKDGPQIWRGAGPTGTFLKSAKLAVKLHRDGKGAVYELAVPWSELEGAAPGLRRSFGFTFAFNDRDSAEGRNYKDALEWTDGLNRGDDASKFGQIVVDYAPPTDADEFFLAQDVVSLPGRSDIVFRLLRSTRAPDETLHATMTLAGPGDNAVAARTELDVPVSRGVSMKEITWRVSGLADGMYDGALRVEAPGLAETTVRFRQCRMDAAPVESRIAALKAAMAQAEANHPKTWAAVEPSVAYRLDLAERWLARASDMKRWQALADLLGETEAIVNDLSEGRDWFAARKKLVVRAYRAPEDGSLVPYKLRVPPEYDGTKPWPLRFFLHGSIGSMAEPDEWYVCSTVPSHDLERHLWGPLVLEPQGRGNCGWALLGQRDVFEALDDVKRHYNVDHNAIYLMGQSMGGSGTWHLACRFPDAWSACSPQLGFPGANTWKRLKDPAACVTWQDKFARANCPLFLLENLLNCPTACYHGLSDPFGSEGTELAFERLRELGYQAVMLADVKQGHGMSLEFERALIEWTLLFKRRPEPPTVRYRTFDLRYNRAYWVTIDELERDYELAEVIAKAGDGGRLDVTVTNIRRLTLNPPPELLKGAAALTIAINGHTLTVPAVGPVHLASADSGKSWAVADTATRPGVIKRHGISGPMTEVFANRFLIVFGTAGSKQATEINRSEALDYRRRLTGSGRGQFTGTFTVKADTDVIDADARSSNLILFGGPDTNNYTRSIAAGLPVTLEGGRLVFRGDVIEDQGAALKFIYPSPANPDRYVVIVCGARPEAIRLVDHFTWPQPDWLVFTPQSVKNRQEPYRDGGFFDRGWR